MNPLEEQPVPGAGSVTQWIGQLKAGDRAAVAKIWERYFKNMVRIARQRLKALPEHIADAEDVALVAFVHFWQGIERGQFSRLGNRDDLIRLLTVITTCKAIDQIRYVSRHLRNEAIPAEGPSRADEPDLAEPAGTHLPPDRAALEQVPDPAPSPAVVYAAAEEFQRLLRLLDDDGLRTIVLCKLDGYSNEEIAVYLNCNPRTIRRRLWLIRRILEKEIDDVPRTDE